ncbi:alpha-2-macroglobulin family protein [Maridesulfovibrio salexigens]|uniref:Alpha-2-macroglobulin domain protein n=1 Tax=Maridesulfovibrio salexigens (strain ATCC 14822 / DSM 2638 / NCIMB 8403 / VKM B-1763) TaxID=526222 RepID=C6BYJ0_MARSD|nr:MG2 domain-containing protein [Maridesulfovibrio salexigens]ACS78781.1 alpha-2-macroglobulin domain protein [Maridesulfovibrio salexigens DSM 2638]
MDRGPTPFKDKKNIIIALLLMICIIQAAGLLKAKHESVSARIDSGDGVKVTDVSLDSQGYSQLLLAFDMPIGPETPSYALKKIPATISPEVKGEWRWINPYALRFTADPAFKGDTRFTIELKPENFLLKGQVLAGEKTFTVQTGSFGVKEIGLQTEPVAGQGRKVRIEGHINFSNYVTPENTLKNISLTGPEGKEIPLSITTNYDDYYQRFVSLPVEKEVDPKTYVLKISKDLPDGRGAMVLGKDYEKKIEVVFDPVLTYSGYKASSSLNGARVELGFSSPVIPAQGLEMLSINPAINVSAAASGKKLILSGSFKPGKKYSVTLKKGLTAADGALLEKSINENIVIPDIEPSADFSSAGMFLSESGYKTLGIETVNTRDVSITVDRVFPNNFFSLFTHYGYMAFDPNTYGGGISAALGNRIFSGKVKTSGKKNMKTTTPLSVKSFIAEGGKGLYRIGAMVPGKGMGVQRWVMVTDLGVVAKQGDEETLFWISSLSDLKPVVDAKVQLISNRNQIMGSGTTNSRGILVFKKKDLRKDLGRPYMAVVTRKNDMTFMLMDRFATDRSGLDIAGQRLSPKGLTAYTYGERNLYRPGETVKGVAVVRDRTLKPPKKMPVVLVYSDQRGRELFRRTVHTDNQGMIEFKRDIPDYSPTGQFNIKLLAGKERIGNFRYSVEDFMPDRISAEILTSKPASVGQKLNFEVEGRYLFGPPAEDLPVSARVMLEPADFTPEGYENYRFNTDKSSFKPREILKTDAKLDESGKFSFSTDIPATLKSDSAIQARMTARVSETGGRGVTASKIDPVLISKFYPGLKKLTKQGYEQGESVKLDYVTLTPNGVKTAAGKLLMKLYRDRWQTIVRATPSGSYKYVTERDPQLLETREISAKDATGSFKVTPPEFGSYRVILSDPESGVSAQADFFCGGWGYSPWALENPARLEIIPTRKGDYKPGEMAEYQIRTPFAGRMMVAIEDNSIRWTKELEVEGNTATIKAPVQKGISTNAYVTATLIRSVNKLEAGSSARAVGAVPLFVDRESNRLGIDITCPKTTRPERTVTLQVQTKPGAKLTIAAVDEGILRLSGQKTPSPFDYFYAKRALGVRWSDTFGLLMPDAGPINKALAGGGMELAMMKQFAGSSAIRRVKPVTFWSGIITADKNGKAEFNAKIPEFSGALRVMAVVSDGRKFGSTSKIMTVRSPLMVTPTLPRFLAPDEIFDIPVSVRNDTPEDGTFNIAVKTSGAMSNEMGLEGFTVPHGRQKTAFFKTQTGADLGPTSFKFSAEGNEEKAGTSIDLNIRAALPVQRSSESGFIKDKSTDLPAKLEGMRVGTAERTLIIGNQPMLRLAGKLDYLLHYPYGCAEQTVSQAFPLLKFPELARELSPQSFEKESPQYMVQSALSRLSMMQTSDGGFAMWPGAHRSEPWVSVYVLHFLQQVAISGYQVDSMLLNRAKRFVANNYADTIREGYSYRLPCYAQYVLARSGKVMHGPMNYLRENKAADMDKLSLTLLAGAFAASGDMAAYRELISAKPAPVKGKDKDQLFSSEVRDIALELLVRMEADRKDDAIPQLANKLYNLMADNGRNVTQDNSLGFLALGSFYGQTKSVPHPSGKIMSGDKELAAFETNGTAQVTVKGDEPLSIMLDAAPEGGSFVWAINSRAVPTIESWKPYSNGLDIKREFLTRDGEPLDLGDIKQGQLVAMRTVVTSTAKPVSNAVISCLLPSGLEPENTKLATREDLPWITKGNVQPDHVDIRDDRVLVFSSIPAKGKVENVTLLRAVTRGEFKVPPVQVEGMYDPEKSAATALGKMIIK